MRSPTDLGLQYWAEDLRILPSSFFFGFFRSTTAGSAGMGAATGLALTVLGAAAAKRQTVRKALRRELAVAYEENSAVLQIVYCSWGSKIV